MKLDTVLPHDPAFILLLGIYPTENWCPHENLYINIIEVYSQWPKTGSQELLQLAIHVVDHLHDGIIIQW